MFRLFIGLSISTAMIFLAIELIQIPEAQPLASTCGFLGGLIMSWSVTR